VSLPSIGDRSLTWPGPLTYGPWETVNLNAVLSEIEQRVGIFCGR
jgi:hypothetical protein